mgnify:CR=1 FL=1
MEIPHIKEYRGQRIHLVGIGGSSMSGLAELLQAEGYQVTGSDRTDGYLMGHLRDLGIPVTIGHRAENVDGAAMVAYSAAISQDNPELIACRSLGIPTLERAWLLGQLMEGRSTSIAVAGTDGKTTTTSMLAQMLMAAGLDPMIHIGGALDAIGGSVHPGKGNLTLTEACEFNRSFLALNPTIAVILNIAEDHLDCYRDIDEIENTFGSFLSLLPPDGIAIGNGEDERVLRQLKGCGRAFLTFGMTESCDFYPVNLQEDSRGYFSFDVCHGTRRLGHVRMGVAGIFNVMDALAAVAAATACGADMEKALPQLESFRGAHRRFEQTDFIDGVSIYHDYGHNPQEMHNVLSIARKQCDGRLWAVMQPHTFSRVRTLFDQYLTCTEAADITLVTDICAAREPDPGDLNSGMLVAGMKANGIDAVWTPSFDDTEAYLRAHWQPGDLVLTMGCGDINLLNDQIHRHEQEKRQKEALNG